MNEPQRRSSDQGRWTRFNSWVRLYPLPAYVFLVIGIAVAVGFAWEAGEEGKEAAEEAKNAVTQSNAEREARIKVAAQINRYVCKENNKQDRILAGLVEVSIGGQSSFGKGIPPGQLTIFDREVLGAIGRIQRLTSAGRPPEFEAAFGRALAQLRQQTPCAALASAFTEASDTKDYEAIRDFLQALDRKDREAADAVAPAPTP